MLLLKPRGFCAGVVRAIDIVKIALETFGAPIYVRQEIVHNRYVVNELAEKGAIFVHEIDDVPDGQRVIYSAHGVSPAVRERSKERNLKVIDATCPLVTKVHIEAVKFAKQGYSLVLIGHRDHDEIEGTLGEAPECDAGGFERGRGGGAGGAGSESGGVSDADDAVAGRGAGHYPRAEGEVPEHRRAALAGHLLRDGESPGCGENVAHDADLVLVVGSTNSSNSNRLVEVSRNLGHDRVSDRNSQAIDPEWLEGVNTVAVTAGASAPEVLVEDVVDYLRKTGIRSVEEVEVMPENVRFGLPPEIVQAIGVRAAAAVPVR